MTSPSIVLLRTQSDARLLTLAREGHERAFEAIVERYRRQLMRTCRRVLPEARAEDALQQALMAAWTAIARGDEVRELRPWLHRIAHRTALNHLRMSGYDFDELHDSLRIADGADEELERRAVMRHTLAGLAALPERQRAALLAIAVDGRSQDEVASDLGLTSGAVRQLVHRARSALRAAATAVTPLPLVSWAAASAAPGEPMASRIAELTAGAGAGGAGAATALAKAGTVAVLAGGAAAGPAMIERASTHRHSNHAQREARAEARAARTHAAAPRAAAPAPAPVATPRTRSAPARSRPATPAPVTTRRVSTAPRQTTTTRRQSSGRSDDGEDHSGRGDGDEVEATPTPEAVERETSNSGPGGGESDDTVIISPSTEGSGSRDLTERDRSGSGSGTSGGEIDSSGPGDGFEEPTDGHSGSDSGSLDGDS